MKARNRVDRKEKEQVIIIIQPALRALGLLLADGAPTVGRGKTF